ncbi:MAG: hypothetical protein ABI867_29850 [Kofleriaceae bacterium]
MLSSAAIAQQERSQMPAGVVFLISPQPGLDYGLNVFAMREPSAGGGADYSAEELALTTTMRLYAGLVIERPGER